MFSILARRKWMTNGQLLLGGRFSIYICSGLDIFCRIDHCMYFVLAPYAFELGRRPRFGAHFSTLLILNLQGLLGERAA